MATDRPTFHESWHRVADLRPTLRGAVQIGRQERRGRVWHVVQDPSGHQFFQLGAEGYFFVGLLDGKRRVGEVWALCNQKLGDAAPTQGEVIQLLGQLYAGNLLASDLPPDAQGLFERYRKRVRKEVRGYLLNVLFARIPLGDPNDFLDRWVRVAGWVFTKVGLVLWCLLLAVAGYFLVGRWGQLFAAADPQTMLNPDNLLWLYVAMVLIKAMHELGHGFAAKHFGQLGHTGGDVHTIGIMLLVFVPVPYVDASSAWLLRSRWQRAVVGAAGMYVELAVAAVAAIIWAQTSNTSSSLGTAVHALAYNMMFIAGISTILFNGNPLLRYDGYYILSDLLEIPNLSQRGKDQLHYLVRRWIFGVRQAKEIARSMSERFWLLLYAVTSGIYRVFISIVILWYVADKFFLLGAIFAVVTLVGWLVIPAGKFVHYLLTSPELLRTRGRAVLATAVTLTVIVVGVGLVPVPDRARAEGIVQPVMRSELYMPADGFVDAVLPSGTTVQADDGVLIEAHNPLLTAREKELAARLEEASLRLRAARAKEQAEAQTLEKQVRGLEQQLAQVSAQRASLHVRSPLTGQWIAPDVDRLPGAYVRRGERLGVVADMSNLVVKVITDQTLGPRVAPEVGMDGVVEMRVKGRPDLAWNGRIIRIAPAGQQSLPSAALATVAGGSTPVDLQQRDDVRALEPMFEVQVQPTAATSDRPAVLYPEQRVIVRFSMPPRPLGAQLWRMLRQAIQRRFQVGDLHATPRS
ncbi:MAG: hypothetical protein WD042_16560 [Phycisphaeraceae bacterium]